MRTCQRLLLVLLPVAAAACSPPAPPDPAPMTEAAVDLSAEMQALEARRAALAAMEAKMDPDGAAALWAEDAVLQLADIPQVAGRVAIRDVYHDFFAGDVVEIRRKSLDVRMAASGELAYSLGEHQFLIMRDGRDYRLSGKYLAVWKKVDGEWLLAAVSATDDMPEPVPIAAQ